MCRFDKLINRISLCIAYFLNRIQSCSKYLVFIVIIMYYFSLQIYLLRFLMEINYVILKTPKPQCLINSKVFHGVNWINNFLFYFKSNFKNWCVNLNIFNFKVTCFLANIGPSQTPITIRSFANSADAWKSPLLCQIPSLKMKTIRKRKIPK